MPVQTLYVTGDKYISIPYPSYPTYPHWDRTVSTDYGYWTYDLYTLQNAVRNGIITNVRVKAYCQARPYQSGYQKGKTVILTGGSVYYGSENWLENGSFAWIYTDYAQNPKTSAAWTWDDIDNLLAGVALIGHWGSSQPYAEGSNVRVEVTNVLVSGGGAQIIGLELL